MKILVLSCDKNQDTWMPFHHCMEKYWPNHPDLIYKTETIDNPYYPTLKVNYPLSQWAVGIREVLDEISDKQVLIMVDDCFIRKPVDTERIKYASEHFTTNTAMFNLEKSFDLNDQECGLEGFKKRRHNSPWEVSIMCGLWDKDKLKNVLSTGGSPWDIESYQNNCRYDYYINSGDYIIDYGYITHQRFGITAGKWCSEVIPFFESEGLNVDYSRGVLYD